MSTITSLDRVLCTLSHKEPDKVPLFLLFSYYGAKVNGISIKEYFKNPSLVVETQLKLHNKYKIDCLFGFHYASLEAEVFGCKTIFVDDGPPNSGEPALYNLKKIQEIKLPEIQEVAGLVRVLETISLLKKEKNDVPIIGVAMSPFSIPVMQMGFEKYLYIMHREPEIFRQLMALNEQFCVKWANAQLEAGATAICYFDPVSSSTNIPPEKYRETGFEIAKRTIAQIKGPTATHFASGRCLPILDDLPKTGTAIAGISSLEDVKSLKQKAAGKITLLGNLNGIEMCRWTAKEAREIIRKLIQQAAPGGGFIIADNHGEIPWYVTEEVLRAITEAVDEFGVYPIT